MRKFQTAGLRVKKSKCQFGVPAAEFLEFMIDAKGVHPTPAKVKAIHSAPQPQSKAEIQAFLGLLNFYHAFLPNKVSVAEPLHRLLEKQVAWVWGTIVEKAFREVKNLISSDSVLVHYDEKLPLVLACNVSPYGIGAVLSHSLPDGWKAPVAFYSRTLSKSERNYAQIDKEALAIVAG